MQLIEPHSHTFTHACTQFSFSDPEVEEIALKGYGTVEERSDTHFEHDIRPHATKLKAADLVIVVAHSQGCADALLFAACRFDCTINPT